jgi:hypothetical protein
MFSPRFPLSARAECGGRRSARGEKRLFHPSWDDPETESSTVRCALKKPGAFPLDLAPGLWAGLLRHRIDRSHPRTTA